MHKELLEVEKKCYLEVLKQTDSATLEKLDDDFKIKYAYDTVYLSGDNTITLEEAYNLDKVSLQQRLSEREQKEFLNHIKAYEFILASLKTTKVSEDFIKDIHQILLEDILPGGLYRQVNVRLVGLHQPPDYIKVYDRMKKMIDHLNDNFEGGAIEKAAFIVLTISKIYPFITGNGRLGRLLMNYYLLQDGYVAISIDKAHRELYYEAIDDFKVNKTMEKMIFLIKKILLDRYNELTNKLE